MAMIPLFPLNNVLFPEGEITLKIFEPRYIDMVSECLRSDTGFGTCLIREGVETGLSAEFFPMGTYARIIDWDQTDSGLLEITATGERRFKVERMELRSDQLRMGEVSWLDDDEDSMPVSYQAFSDLLKEISHRYELPYTKQTERFDDAKWVSERLAELLPFEMSAKQALLEMDNALHRLDYMQALLEKIDSGEYSKF